MQIKMPQKMQIENRKQVQMQIQKCKLENANSKT